MSVSFDLLSNPLYKGGGGGGWGGGVKPPEIPFSPPSLPSPLVQYRPLKRINVTGFNLIHMLICERFSIPHKNAKTLFYQDEGFPSVITEAEDTPQLNKPFKIPE